MEAEFFIHGPRHAFYGKPEESQYCQLFDNSQIKDDIRFIVEVRKAGNGKWCTYYNYCRYANVLDIDGRSGAYIGLTVRLDAYYANLRNMYTVLEAVFMSRVVGLLLKKIPSGFQYIVSDFKNSHQSILTNVEKNLGGMLMGIIADDEVYPIDSSFTSGGKEIVKGLDDNQYSLARLSDIKKSGKLVFASSKDIDLVDEMNREFERRKEALKEEQEKEIEKIKRSLDEAGEREASLKDDIAKRTEQITHLEEEKKGLEKDVLVKEQEKEELGKKLQGLSSIEDKLNALQKELDTLRRDKQSLEKGLKERDDRIRQLGASNHEKHSGHSSHHAVSSSLSGSNSNGRIDSEQSRGEKQRRIDKVSSKWSFKELGEGLKIGIFAFFLIALIAAAILFFMRRHNSKVDQNVSSKVDASLSAETQEPVRDQCLSIPNQLTKRVFPQCGEGGTSDMLTIKRSDLDPNKVSIYLTEPAITVYEYEWLVKDSGSATLFQDKTSHNSVSFTLEDGVECTVRVFVNDTLIVMKRIP